MRKIAFLLSFLFALSLVTLTTVVSADTCVDLACTKTDGTPGTETVCCPSIGISGPEKPNVCGTIDSGDGQALVAGCSDASDAPGVFFPGFLNVAPAGCIKVGPADISFPFPLGDPLGTVCEHNAVAACRACGCATTTGCQ